MTRSMAYSFGCKCLVGIIAMSTLIVSGCGPSRNDLLLRSAQRSRDTDDSDSESKPAEQSAQPGSAAATPESNAAAETANNPATPATPSAPAASPDATATADAAATADATGTTTTDATAVPAGEDAKPVELRTGEEIVQSGLVPIDERTPEEPLSDLDRRKMAAENLEKVAEALIAYERDRKALPKTFSTANGFQTLSWRVEILPYLGYQELYDKFDKTVPWNRSPNEELLKFIPDVYASPERFDTKTNIVMPAGSGMIGGDGGGLALENRIIEDGVANTLLLIEVGDKLAVPWTAPEDFAPKGLGEVSDALGKLREDGTYAVWANGWTTLLASSLPPRTILDAMTIEQGDGLQAGNIHRDITLENVTDASVAADDAEATPETPMVDETPIGPQVVAKNRDPVPTGGEIVKVQNRFRQVFADRLADVKSDTDRLELAKELLQKSAEMEEDPVGAYALQTAAMKLAIESGGIDELLQGVDMRISRFEVDAFEENMTWMLEFGTGVRDRDVDTIDGMAFTKRAVHVIFAAIHDDEYVKASSLARYSFRLIDEDRDEDLPKNLTRLRGLLGQAKRDFDEASKSMATYRNNPKDGDAAADIGRFLCFIKGDWKRGLPLLTEGGPEVLQDIAKLDMQGAKDIDNQVAIGDAWWELSEKARTSVYRQAARDRATVWYKQAFDVMPDSLDKLHVKARLDEVEDVDATSPLALIRVLADEVGVDLTVSLAAVAEPGGRGGVRRAGGSADRNDRNEG